VTKTWIIHIAKNWHKSRQDGVDGKRKPAIIAEYNLRQQQAKATKQFKGNLLWACV